MSWLILPWPRGRQRDRVATVDLVSRHRSLATKWEHLVAASYGLEVFDQLIVGQEPDRQLFKLLVEFLDALNVTESRQSSQLILDYFILHLLILLGYAPTAVSSLAQEVVLKTPLIKAARQEMPLKIKRSISSTLNEHLVSPLKVESSLAGLR